MKPVAFALVTLAVWCAGAGAASVPVEDRIRAAVVEAVRQRMGPGTRVIVDDLEIFSPAGLSPSEATPAPGARLGPRVPFVLHAQIESDGRPLARPAGSATVAMRVVAPHVTAARLIPRGRAIAADDVVERTGEVTDVPMRRLPIASEVIGARVLRDIAAGALITASAVALPGAVKSGQTVRAVASIDGVQVTASLVSLQSGQIGDVIRVVNRDSRRELRARVTGDGAVEVIP